MSLPPLVNTPNKPVPDYQALGKDVVRSAVPVVVADLITVASHHGIVLDRTGTTIAVSVVLTALMRWAEARFPKACRRILLYEKQPRVTKPS